MAEVSAKIHSCTVSFSIMKEPDIRCSGKFLPTCSVRHLSSYSRVAGVILGAAILVSVAVVPSPTPRAVFIQSISEAEVSLMSNFMTLDGFFIRTADGKIFCVAE